MKAAPCIAISLIRNLAKSRSARASRRNIRQRYRLPEAAPRPLLSVVTLFACARWPPPSPRRGPCHPPLRRRVHRRPQNLMLLPSLLGYARLYRVLMSTAWFAVIKAHFTRNLHSSADLALALLRARRERPCSR